MYSIRTTDGRTFLTFSKITCKTLKAIDRAIDSQGDKGIKFYDDDNYIRWLHKEERLGNYVYEIAQAYAKKYTGDLYNIISTEYSDLTKVKLMESILKAEKLFSKKVKRKYSKPRETR